MAFHNEHAGETAARAASRSPVALALVALLGAALGGCGVNRTQIATDIETDARLRHPIALTERAYTVDLFPTGSTIDRRTQEQVAAFAHRYQRLGRGPISIMTPASGPAAGPSHRSVDAVRRELARNGAGAHVTVSSYPVADPALAAPMRLAFDGIGAKVAHKCGEWPSDLASGSSNRGWDNKPYWNFGCANQNMIATQVADPRDIAEPRGEAPSDMSMRLRAITNIRKGDDPATNWKMKNTSIGSVGN